MELKPEVITEFKQSLKWIIPFAIFLSVFASSLITLFAPYRYYEASPDGEITGMQEIPITTIRGLTLMGKSWIEAPDYNAQIVLTLILGIGGAIYCIYQLDKAKRKEKESELNT